MKITYRGETKRVPDIADYYDLLEYISQIFKIESHDPDYSEPMLYYLDDDGDLISVSCNSDLEQAKSNQKSKIKLTYANNDGVARKNLL